MLSFYHYLCCIESCRRKETVLGFYCALNTGLSIIATYTMQSFCVPKQSVSSHLATMLSSHDLKIIVGAIQMAEILMLKLPEIFAIYFRREGVMHQIKRLCDLDATLGAPAAKWSSPELSLGSGRGSTPGSASPLLPDRSSFNGNIPPDSTPPSLATPPSQEDEKLQSPSQLRLYDVLKRKRTARIPGGSWRKRPQDDSSSASTSFSEFFMKSEFVAQSSSKYL